jgi:hypothetical protein
MSKKGELFILVLCLFLVSIMFVTAVPPPPPADVISPPTYCTATNGGVEICDSIDNDCDGTVDEGGVCTVTPPPTGGSGGGGGGGGGGSSRPSTTVTKNTTNTTSTVKPIVNNTTPVKEPEVFINSTLVEIIPLADKVENLSQSETNQKLFTIFNFTPLKIFIVGSILMCMVVFLSIFILDYSRKRTKAKTQAVGSTVSSGVKTSSDARKPELTNIKLSAEADKVKSESKISTELSSQEMQAMNYINAMRQKGFKEDYIMDQLRNKGWKEEVLSKLFRK